MLRVITLHLPPGPSRTQRNRVFTSIRLISSVSFNFLSPAGPEPDPPRYANIDSASLLRILVSIFHWARAGPSEISRSGSFSHERHGSYQSFAGPETDPTGYSYALSFFASSIYLLHPARARPSGIPSRLLTSHISHRTS